MNRQMGSRIRYRSRRGGVYILVIIAVGLVSLMTLLGMEVQRAARRSSRLSSDAAEARVLAQSAIDVGLEMISSDANWRTKLPASGAWMTKRTLGSGMMLLAASDPNDGDFTNNPDDTIVLVGTGMKGQATQMVQVTLQSAYQPLASVSGAAHAGAGLYFNSTTVSAPLVLSANTLVSASGSCNITAPVEAVTTITGSKYNSGTTSLVPIRAMPAASTFSTYASIGTSIKLSDLGNPRIRRTVLSPANNPFGTKGTNPLGIYVIDCQGQDFDIEDCRIVGTLVLLNAGSGTQVQNSVSWEQTVPGYPALLVQGSVTLNISSSSLKESDFSVNFNPSGTPYGGASNATKTDSYPSRLAGIVYASGNISVQSSLTLQGCLVAGGSISVGATLSITPDTILSTSPPPAFRTGPTMIISPGSWKQVVN